MVNKSKSKSTPKEGLSAWYGISANQMMRDDYKNLIDSLKSKGAKFESFHSEGGNKIYLKIKNESPSVDKLMSQFTYYHPVSKLSKAPKIGGIFK